VEYKIEILTQKNGINMKTEKEFIKYKQALILKELGFDEPCIGWYNPQVNYKKVTTDKYWAFHLTGEWENFKSAPLYQQAFRWIRERYPIYSIINIRILDSLIITRFCYNIFDLKNKKMFKSNYYDTYDEACIACLDKIIKMIKKNKYEQIEYEETEE